MTAVKVGRDENVEVAIKKFLNKIKKSGMLEELQERRYYEKPSAKRNKEARRRHRALEKLKNERSAEKE